MAKICGQSLPVELSYIDLCELLAKDIQDDACMPDEIRGLALKVLGFLEDVISPYSG